MKKQDGRKNNGGAREGAGRPRKYAYIPEIDDLPGGGWLDSYTTTLQKRGNQTHWVKTTQFDAILNYFAKDNLFLQKGYRRVFTSFVKAALDTDDEDIFEYRESRFAYVVNHGFDEEEAKKKEKEVKPKDPGRIEFEKYQKEDEERQKKIRNQNEVNAEAINRYRKWTGKE